MRYTALELELLSHYKMADHDSGPWDSVRVRRLCRQLQITEAELSRLIRIAPFQMEKFAENNKYPAIVRLVLELVERSTNTALLGSTPKKPLIHTLDGRLSNS